MLTKRCTFATGIPVAEILPPDGLINTTLQSVFYRGYILDV
jgi:hypothetical protein